MKRKRFSIIIPTRERHETLGYTIKTILNQDFDDYEIVVADNCSSRETRDLVDAFTSEKIRYFRSEFPLSMVDNWEFALSNANGEYVIILGDDDGLIAGCLKTIHSVIDKTKSTLIQWERAYYSWPNLEPSIFANILNLKYNKENELIDGHQLIDDVINFRTPYTCLPMLYNSAAHFSLIERLRKSSGRFFHSTVPDVFSGFALAHMSGKFISLGIPMSINAGSAKSNGVSFMFKKSTQTVNNDYKKLNDSGQIEYDADIPFVRSFPIAAIEPYVRFIKVIKGSDNDFNYLDAYIRIIRSLICYDEEEWNFSSKDIMTRAKSKNLDIDKLKKELARVKLKDIESIEADKIGFYEKELVLDASKFGVNDVFDLSIFVAKFYDFRIFEKETLQIKPVSATNKKMPIINRIKKSMKIIFTGKL